MDPRATAGRIVHYTDATGRPIAAIVCIDADPDGLVPLTTFFPGKAPTPMRAVPYSEEPIAGCWSWMPYQRAKVEGWGGNQSESAEPRPPDDLRDKLGAWLERRFAEFTESVREEFNDLNGRIEALEMAGEKEALA
ncbi:hypothetical protein LCGC14_1683460, partial [marine sediment metagenome]